MNESCSKSGLQPGELATAVGHWSYFQNHVATETGDDWSCKNTKGLEALERSQEIHLKMSSKK